LSISCHSPLGDLGVSLAIVSPCKPQTEGPVRTHPWPYEFAMDPMIGTTHLLRSWAASQAHTFTHSHTAQYFHPTPQTSETRFHPKRRLLECLIGRWSISPSASWGRPEFELRFLPVWWAVLPSPHWFLCLTGFCCASEAFPPTHREDESLLWIKLSIAPGGISSQLSGGTHPGGKRGDISLCPHNPGQAPKKCCGRLLAEIQDTEAV
jgi:hypothetical protein